MLTFEIKVHSRGDFWEGKSILKGGRQKSSDFAGSNDVSRLQVIENRFTFLLQEKGVREGKKAAKKLFLKVKNGSTSFKRTAEKEKPVHHAHFRSCPFLEGHGDEGESEEGVEEREGKGRGSTGGGGRGGAGR